MKTRIFALALAASTTLLATVPAQAATFNLNPGGGSVVILGLPFQEGPPLIATIGVSFSIDVSVGPPVLNPGWQPGLGVPLYMPAYWNGLFEVGVGSISGSGSKVALFGQCITGPCGGIAFPGNGPGGTSFTFSIADHPESVHTLYWRLFLQSGSGGPGGQLISLTPHLTLTTPDNLYPTPLPAALPLFAAGLGIVTFLARRKKTAAVRSA